ncbi:MAG TPA: hypothetical protein VEG36_12675 [Burkholderiales bacterium]|nr:hypothetical protein [Burkholderiales bacterium]
MGASRRAWAFALPAVLCAAWTIYAGKDLNWDLLNYHYYLPYEWLDQRVGQDFFAASAQSYLNPAGYIPFYLMVSAGWHSVLVSVVLALLHSLSLPLLYLLAWRLFAHRAHPERAILSLLAATLGAATAVLWETIGTSFLDPLIIPPLLAGLLLLVDEAPGNVVRRAALAGALFGVAAALKYSAAIFGLAALPLAAAMPGTRGMAKWRASFSYVAGGVLAVAVLAGPWLALMQREFGNPVFPLMNAWFRSPYFASVNLAGDRFGVDGVASLFSFPFRMISLDRSVYSENFAPDLRFAALLAIAVCLPVVAAMRPGSRDSVLRGPDWRLFAFFSVAFALWLASSANARYGLLVLLLAGLCLARLVDRVLPPFAARVVLVLLLALQVGMTIIASPARWFIAEPWSKRWLAYDVPQRALREPALYLTVEVLPLAVIAPLVNPESSFVNFRGQLSIPGDSPRLSALLRRYRGRVRVLGRDIVPVAGRPPVAALQAYDRTLKRIGFRVDPDDCFTIAWRPDFDDELSRVANLIVRPLPPHEALSASSCGLRPVARDPAEEKEERRVSALFDGIERACPRLFRRQTAVTEPLLNGWSRYYTGLDARLEAFGDHVVLNFLRSGRHVDLGKLSAWEREPAPLPGDCRSGSDRIPGES